MFVLGLLATAGFLAGALYCFNRALVYGWRASPESGRAAGIGLAIIGAVAAAGTGLVLSSWLRGRH